jgi:tRNA-dihydrouridine synthase
MELFTDCISGLMSQGGGSALLEHVGKLGKSLTGMSRVLGEIPLTIKMRTGVRDGHNVAHKLVLRAQREWGVGAVTVGATIALWLLDFRSRGLKIHGRTRQQRSVF